MIDTNEQPLAGYREEITYGPLSFDTPEELIKDYSRRIKAAWETERLLQTKLILEYVEAR